MSAAQPLHEEPAPTALPRVGLTPAAQRHALEAAVADARAAVADAVLHANRAELARSKAAAALEAAVPPTSIDEAGRARLREAYAVAAASVDSARSAVSRARELEQAAVTVSAALDDRQGVLGVRAATAIAEVLAFRRHGSARSTRSTGPRRAPRRATA